MPDFKALSLAANTLICSVLHFRRNSFWFLAAPTDSHVKSSDYVGSTQSVWSEIHAVVALAFVLVCAAAAQTDWLAPDPSVIAKFHDEEAQHSQVMEVMGYLTDVYGPRLTNSPEYSGGGRIRGQDA